MVPGDGASMVKGLSSMTVVSSSLRLRPLSGISILGALLAGDAGFFELRFAEAVIEGDSSESTSCYVSWRSAIN